VGELKYRQEGLLFNLICIKLELKLTFAGESFSRGGKADLRDSA